MEHRDRPGKIQLFTVPAGRHTVPVDVDAVSLETCVGRGECCACPSRCRGRRDKRPAAGVGEPHVTIFPKLDREALLVHCAVVPPTQQHKIAEPGCAPVGPVPYVVGVAVTGFASRKTATAVTGSQRPSDCRRNGAGLTPDIEYGSRLVMPHDDGGRVARDASGRLRGDADTVFHRRLAGV